MDFVSAFLESTENISSPELFRKWAAISCLAGAMERKVWVRTLGSNLYPSLYIILVANPGVGKTEVTWRVRELWESLSSHHIAPSNVSRASLIDALNEATRNVTRVDQVPAVLSYNALLISINELGVLIPAYEAEFMAGLTDLFDGKPYAEKKRTHGLNIKIDRPYINMLAACTPAYLSGTLPEGAWDQGFTSRTILIYSGEIVLKDLFLEESADSLLQEALKDKLRAISEISGQFSFSDGAKQILNRWNMSGGKPRPEHPKLFHYLSRRTSHVLKLCMIASLSEGNDLLITEDHVRRAMDWLAEAELYMPDIFKAMANNSHAEILKETWHFILNAWNKSNHALVPESRVVNFLSMRTPAHNVTRVLEVMVAGGLIRKDMSATDVGYYPIEPTKP